MVNVKKHRQTKSNVGNMEKYVLIHCRSPCTIAKKKSKKQKVALDKL